MSRQAFDATLTDLANGEYVRFWPTPSSLPSEHTTSEREWSLLRGGTIRQPRGPQPGTHTLSGFFAGADDVGEPWYPDDWRPPREILEVLHRWVNAGEDAPVLRLLVTEIGVDADVYVQSVAQRWGELDRAYVDVVLVELRTLQIEVISREDLGAIGAGGTVASGVGGRRGRLVGRQRRSAEPPAAVPERYVVRDGQTLPIVAALVYGDSARWVDIQAANADVLPDDWQDSLPAGLELRIPGGEPTRETLAGSPR